jgi:hypothetical protein
MSKKPNIFIVGPSGSGKSTCLRNMDPKSTIILNTENKELPFPNKVKRTRPKKDNPTEMETVIGNRIPTIFYDTNDIKILERFWSDFETVLKHPQYKTIIIDSFTGLTEIIFRVMGKIYSGFDLWGKYNEEIDKILNRSKTSDKYVVFTGVDMTIDGANGVEERAIAVQGNKWKKLVEKEFVIILYTKVTDTADSVDYNFLTNKRQGYPAKSPMDMLELLIPNDLNEVINSADAYYDATLIDVTTPEPTNV